MQELRLDGDRFSHFCVFSSCPDDAYSMLRKLEERRMSSLDHHWAVPKHKWSQESRDADNEAEPEGEARTEAEVDADADRDAEVEQDKGPAADVDAGRDADADADPDAGLVKSSCHDSGIDIRDADQVSLPPILPCAKKVAVVAPRALWRRPGRRGLHRANARWWRPGILRRVAASYYGLALALGGMG